MTAPLPDAEQPATRGQVQRLHGRLDDIQRELHEKFVTESDLQLVRLSVQKVEDWQTWAMRLVLGAFILALVALVIAQPAR